MRASIFGADPDIGLISDARGETVKHDLAFRVGRSPRGVSTHRSCAFVTPPRPRYSRRAGGPMKPRLARALFVTSIVVTAAACGPDHNGFVDASGHDARGDTLT